MKPGQTKTLPPNATDTEALISFYQSLHEQRPNSEMAQRFLMVHGLFEDDEEAARVAKKLGKAAKAATKSSGGGGSSSKPKKKVRLVLPPFASPCLSVCAPTRAG